MALDKTIISVSGYGYSGSGAVLDWLKGSKDVEVLDDFEFQIHYFPDAIRDLDYKLNEVCSRHYDSDLAICRFLDVCKKLDRWYEPLFHGKLESMAKEYIDRLHPVTWNGYWAYDRLITEPSHISEVDKMNESIRRKNARIHLANRFLRKVRLPQLEYIELYSYYQKRTMYQCIKPECFLDETRRFTGEMLGVAVKTEAPFVAADQLLPPQCPQDYYKYFPCKVKSIVVRRDPRDMFIFLNKIKWPVVPYEDVKTFIEWYRMSLREDINPSDVNVFRLQFEDLIYEFENTSSKINSFLGLSGQYGEGKFDPMVSVANTRMYLRFPEYRDAVERIETCLPEYLYDFDSHKNILGKSDMIF